ncbi:MAG: metallophosphoesterase family protein [Ferruginibacter sp.]
MTKVGLFSDTHSYLDPAVFKHFDLCDEIWHAGDIGDVAVIDALMAFKPLRIIYGNIDNQEIRSFVPADLVFECNGLKVVMTHIGGYPGKYSAHAKNLIAQHNPGLFVCGHSHILKIIYDKQNQLLHINPGAAGNHGWHQVKTLVRFSIENGKVLDLEIIEIPRNKD